MKQHELDHAVAAVREQQPEEKVVRDAAGRVFRRLFETSFLGAPVETIRGCSDFQTLIPAYLSRSLTPARALLLEDHTRECVACRQALRETREGKLESAVRPAAESRRRVPVMAWALAATLIVGIAAGITGVRYGLLPGQQSVRATVAAVEGRVYRISELGSSLVEAGALLKNTDELRTAKGSRAILRLMGGSEVEIAERSDVSVSRGWRGTRVNLQQGRLIAAATDPRQRAFYVSSGEMSVPVRSALLSVDRGTKGSRVAVARGSARIARGQNTFDLIAGQQIATNGLENVPIASQFDWSTNAGSYLAVLGELSGLQKQFQSIPSPGLRYSSNLAKYVPDDSVVYAAIPNIGGAVAEAKRMFDERLTQSDVLRNWWTQQPASRGEELDRVIGQVASISSYLGDEIVVSLPPHGAPLLLAEVHQAGLAEYVQQNLPPSAGLHISVTNNILLASPDPARITRAGSGQFTNSAFYARIAKSYSAGAGYLLAIDLEQIAPKNVVNRVSSNVQYLVLERRGSAGGSDTRASLSFDGARQGIASWLGTPGPMGSLNFVSPDASLAASFVMKSPRAVMEEAIGLATQRDSRFPGELSAFEAEAGVSVLDDIAAPLGSDATFAIDGPLLPVPSWKLAIEVNDPVRLQQTISTLIDRFNQHAQETQGKVQAGSEQIDSRTFYWLRGSKLPNLTFYYTFVDGYLLAGANETSLLQAIQNRQNANTLVNSANFRNQLPADNYTNFSGVVYTNAGSSFGPLMQQLKGASSLSPAQQQSLSALLASSGPALVCIYGEPDRIVAASHGSFLGFDLGTLMGIQQGRPLLPLVASSARSTLRK
jgi:ferric-dicitrate binding protein FerR (iron transport regulator)